LTSIGFTASAATNIINAGASESVVVDEVIKGRVWGGLAAQGSLPLKKLTPESQARIKTAIIDLLAGADPLLKPSAMTLMLCNSALNIGNVQGAETVIKSGYKDRPAYANYLYSVYLKGVEPPSGIDLFALDKTAGMAELVELMLAPEPMPRATLNGLLVAFKQRVELLARKKLVAEKKSFTTKPNGVNPLVKPVKAVLDTLDNPSCAGLEAALTELGETVPSIDRTEFNRLAGLWYTQIRDGDLIGADVTAKLPKVALFLGFKEYNKFVDAYNGKD
jgi:hypothetical protein